MRRLGTAICAAASVVALGAQSAGAQDEPLAPASATPATPQASTAPAPTTGAVQGPPIVAPPAPKTTPAHPVPAPSDGGTAPSPKPSEKDAGKQHATDANPQPSTGGASDTGSNPFSVSIPAPSFGSPGPATGSCLTTSPPPGLLPIYQRAAAAYGLGPQGPAVLAAINQIETNFGELNHVTSSAGAIGWMQFMPSTWTMYGVDANGDGSRDPYDPEDAIFAAARYLRASGMPEDTAGAIYAYNHADWYVSEVLANAGCMGTMTGGGFTLEPRIPVLSCKPAPGWANQIPGPYLSAFEGAAGRYDLGRRGVWALAAVARLESDFGKGMTKRQLRRSGPLGLDAWEWRRYGVDGDADGVVRHSSIGDSAATLARLAWSRGGLEAGLFSHNQAQWYVDEVIQEADAMAGTCRVTTVAWRIQFPQITSSPINWQNLALSNSLERRDLDTGAIDPRIVGLIGAITQSHTITISALRSDHSMYAASGYVSNHYYGRAMDIAVVDGVPCTNTSPSAPCGQLGESLAHLAGPSHPTELIYCYDLDGPSGPAWAQADHCDHVHVGFDR
ncbi:MAG: lytic murein transglycosylase [Solirubrobacterales bacterium]